MDHPNCLLPRLRVYSLPEPWRSVLYDTLSRGVKLPEPDVQSTKGLNVVQGDLCRAIWHDQQRAIGKVAVARGLLKTLPPIFQLRLNRSNVNAPIQRNGREVLGVRRLPPREPKHVSTAIPVQSELASGNELNPGTASFLREIRALESRQKVALSALGRRRVRQVLARVLSAETYETRKSGGGRHEVDLRTNNQTVVSASASLAAGRRTVEKVVPSSAVRQVRIR